MGMAAPPSGHAVRFVAVLPRRSDHWPG